MAHSTSKHDHGHGVGHHIIPQGRLAFNFVLLTILMVATIGAAFTLPSMIPGISTLAMNLVALGIACVKAYLVITIFMGVKFATRLTKLFAWGGFAWFLLLFLMFADYATRPLEKVPGWEAEGATALPRTTFEEDPS